MMRLQQLQAKMQPSAAYLLSSIGDIRYFSGFEFLVPAEREALLLVTKKSAMLLHASFSPVDVPDKITRIPGCYPTRLKTQVQKLITGEKIASLAIDKETLYVSELEQLQELKELELVSLDRDVIWQLRINKSAEEISHMRQAGKITSAAIAKVIQGLEAGMTELDVEGLLEAEMQALGSGQPAFPTIVAFGNNTAKPHHQPSNQPLKDNMPVLIDAGATYQGYCADMTRSFWFGSQPHDTYIRLEKVVAEAYQAALSKLNSRKKELEAQHIDEAARGVISKYGYAQQFIHTTGHGLGLDIHEQPSLSWANNSLLKKNMTVTVEPGIYLEGLFGYRYENTVLLGKNKAEELTK